MTAAAKADLERKIKVAALEIARKKAAAKAAADAKAAEKVAAADAAKALAAEQAAAELARKAAATTREAVAAARAAAHMAKRAEAAKDQSGAAAARKAAALQAKKAADQANKALTAERTAADHARKSLAAKKAAATSAKKAKSAAKKAAKGEQKAVVNAPGFANSAAAWAKGAAAYAAAAKANAKMASAIERKLLAAVKFAAEQAQKAEVAQTRAAKAVRLKDAATVAKTAAAKATAAEAAAAAAKKVYTTKQSAVKVADALWKKVAADAKARPSQNSSKSAAAMKTAAEAAATAAKAAAVKLAALTQKSIDLKATAIKKYVLAEICCADDEIKKIKASKIFSVKLTVSDFTPQMLDTVKKGLSAAAGVPASKMRVRISGAMLTVSMAAASARTLKELIKRGALKRLSGIKITHTDILSLEKRIAFADEKAAGAAATVKKQWDKGVKELSMSGKAMVQAEIEQFKKLATQMAQDRAVPGPDISLTYEQVTLSITKITAKIVPSSGSTLLSGTVSLGRSSSDPIEMPFSISFSVKALGRMPAMGFNVPAGLTTKKLLNAFTDSDALLANIQANKRLFDNLQKRDLHSCIEHEALQLMQ